jgi:hypothetical protein
MYIYPVQWNRAEINNNEQHNAFHDDGDAERLRVSRAGCRSHAEAVAKMMEYNKALQKAGVLLALDGLFPPSTGARVSYAEGKATATDGPFAEAKEVIGGYWIIQVRSREEAIEWAKRAPMSNNEAIAVRQIQEIPDFPEDVQKAAEGFVHRNIVA